MRADIGVRHDDEARRHAVAFFDSGLRRRAASRADWRQMAIRKAHH